MGLALDSRWNFVKHFRHLVSRLERSEAAFRWLLPNLWGSRCLLPQALRVGRSVHGPLRGPCARARRDDMPGCHHCVDRPQDTVEVYPAWAEHHRIVLEATGGDNLSSGLSRSHNAGWPGGVRRRHTPSPPLVTITVE